MPVVKRFRALGEPRSEESKPAKQRKTRSDKKHRFTLRISQNNWDQIREISLNLGGVETGASFNVICIELITAALSDKDIVKQIQDKFPSSNNNLVRIRTWEV